MSNLPAPTIETREGVKEITMVSLCTGNHDRSPCRFYKVTHSHGVYGEPQREYRCLRGLCDNWTDLSPMRRAPE